MSARRRKSHVASPRMVVAQAPLRITDDVELHMECEEEELSHWQREANKRAEREYKEALEKIKKAQAAVALQQQQAAAAAAQAAAAKAAAAQAAAAKAAAERVAAAAAAAAKASRPGWWLWFERLRVHNIALGVFGWHTDSTVWL